MNEVQHGGRGGGMGARLQHEKAHDEIELNRSPAVTDLTRARGEIVYHLAAMTPEQIFAVRDAVRAMAVGRRASDDRGTRILPTNT